MRQWKCTEWSRDKEVHKHHLAFLFVGSADIAQFIQESVAKFNGSAPTAANFDLMHELLARSLAFSLQQDDRARRNVQLGTGIDG